MQRSQIFGSMFRAGTALHESWTIQTGYDWHWQSHWRKGE
jgi:hypothetical protein